jgi:hypothetical protein
VGFPRRCETCGLPIPAQDRIDPITIPCSKDHTRCIRCGWPFATSVMDEDYPEICGICLRSRK